MFHIDKTLVNKVRMSVTPMSIYFFLLPADRGVTVLHHVSDVIQSNLKWRINPNSAAKVRRFFGTAKFLAKKFADRTLWVKNMQIICNFNKKSSTAVPLRNERYKKKLK